MGGDCMKDVLAAIADEVENPDVRRNRGREYLQARMLHVLQVEHAGIVLAFMGGTALRFAYKMPRYSEDINFALASGRAGYDLERYATALKRTFEREGYRVRVKIKQRTAVAKLSVYFYGVPRALGLSPLADEALMIRIEVDTSPPDGATLAVSEVWSNPRVRAQHYDKPSLFAGKIAAIFGRPYLKGRDVYDVDWLMGARERIEPNRELLRAALAQTAKWQLEEGAAEPTELARTQIDAIVEQWPRLVLEKLEAADWESVEADAMPFLESPSDAWTMERDWVLGRVRAYMDGPA